MKHKLCFEFIFPFFDFEVMNSGDDDEDEYSTRSANKLQPQMVGFLFSKVWTTLICRPLNLTHKQIYFPTNRPFIANSSLTHRSMDQRVPSFRKYWPNGLVNHKSSSLYETSIYSLHSIIIVNRQIDSSHAATAAVASCCFVVWPALFRQIGRVGGGYTLLVKKLYVNAVSWIKQVCRRWSSLEGL